MTSAGAAFDAGLTAEEWWAEFHANACCANRSIAAARLCGCGGSAQLPSGISRMLFEHNHRGA